MPTPTPAARASAWEWIQAAILAANLAWTTLCLGGYRPETMVVTGALTGALVAVYFLSRMFAPAPSPHPAGWLLLPFLAYAAANVLWVTPVRWLGWRDWFGWAEMIAIFWVVLNGVRSLAPRRMLFAALVALGVVAVLLGCYQHFVQPDWMMLGRVQAEQFLTRTSGCFGIPNSLAAFLILLLPAVGTMALGREASRAQRAVSVAVALLFTFGLVLTISRGAWLGLALALSAWPLAAAPGGWRRRFLLAGAIVGALAAMFAALYAVSPDVRDRLNGLVRDAGEKSRPIMWRAAWRLFREHPATGSGAGSYNVLFEKHRPEQFGDEPQWAHNDYLNTLSDYGAVGFVLFFGAVAAMAWRCARAKRESLPHAADWLGAQMMTTALAVGLAAFALHLFVEFHLKIPALAMTVGTIGALVIQRRWPVAAVLRTTSLGRVMAALAAAAALAGTACCVVPRFRAESLRYRAHQAIDRLALTHPDAIDSRMALALVRSELARAVAIDPANAQAWADVAYADSLWAHVEPQQTLDLGRTAETAAARALALSKVVGEFWIRRGVARDMQNRWLEAGDDFSHALTLSPQNALAWYYYAYHLSLDSHQRELALAALQFCLRLDPGNAAGLALRQHLAISPKAP